MPTTSAHLTRPLPADAAEAILAVSRLEAAGRGGGDLQQVRESLVDEGRALLGVRRAGLLAIKDGGRRAVAVGGDARGGVSIDSHAVIARLAGGQARAQPVTALSDAAKSVEALIGGTPPIGSALLLHVTLAAEEHILLLADPHPDAFTPKAIAAITALADAGADALARGRAADFDARRAARQSALTSAAKTLNASLDLETVLGRICREATRILDGDHACVFRATRDGLRLDAGFGLDPKLIGFELLSGQGLSGKVLNAGRPMLTNHYEQISDRPPNSPFSRVRSSVAAPMRAGDDLRGVIAVGYVRPFELTGEHLAMLETFAELAAVACTNAKAHAGLALVARTDGLTGCLNHAALHESLTSEIERAERSDDPRTSLIMFDVDDFKTINEVHGHLVGDEVLRRAGSALREVTRPYDVAARYGGDEFAILAVDSDELVALEVARRAIDRVSRTIGEICPGDRRRITAGVADWAPGMTPTELIARADRALLFGKHEGGRGSAVASATVPTWFRPARFSSISPLDRATLTADEEVQGASRRELGVQRTG